MAEALTGGENLNRTLMRKQKFRPKHHQVINNAAAAAAAAAKGGWDIYMHSTAKSPQTLRQAGITWKRQTPRICPLL